MILRWKQLFTHCVGLIVALVLWSPQVHGDSNPVLGRDVVVATEDSIQFVPADRRVVLKRFVSSTDESEQSPLCRRFLEGVSEQGEFWSPNWPNNYPNNSYCTRVLTAKVGHLLRLDFRDEFHLEPSEGCKFDYLEVREGPYGYGDLIGKYCGNDYPPMITSPGRYLWLRFHSDENIEYKGFSAVYESIEKPVSPDSHPEMPDCLIEVGGSQGLIKSTDIMEERRAVATKYEVPLECMWIIRVPEGWKINLQFPSFDLSKPNDCQSNYVDVFADRTDIPNRLKRFCGSIADSVASKSHILHVRFLMHTVAFTSKFEANYTAYRDSKSKPCTQDEFDCQDETCISRELRCNELINCRFRWDEDDCNEKMTALQKILSTDHIIIILVVFTLILFGMCFAFIFNCVRKLMHDHRIIRENIRQSRGGHLDEVGIKVASSPRVLSGGRSRSSSHDDGRRSLSPRHLLRGARVEDQEGVRAASQDCYVPGAGDLMPILLGAATRPPAQQAAPANGDAVFLRDSQPSDDEDVEMANYPLPEMRDNECQTRESLFNNSSSERSVTPPPPPPPVVVRPQPHPRLHNTRTQTHDLPPPPLGQFSTFGYNRENRREPPSAKDYETLPPPRVAGIRKGESVVARAKDIESPTAKELDAQRFRAEAVIEMESAEDRPFSVDSTKSAPDVIVTH